MHPSYKFLEHAFDDGGRIRIDAVAEGILRVRLLQSGDPGGFGGSALNTYGFIRDGDGSAAPLSRIASGHEFAAGDGVLTVRCSQGGREIRVLHADGRELLHQESVTWQREGVTVRFRAAAEEDWMGFGDQTRDRLFHRGFFADCHVRNVRTYIPVPFFMSTGGVGVLVNTTHRIVFDMCASSSCRYEWRDGGGRLDYYVMIGASFLEILRLYTSLTGRPRLPPEWSFGLWYIARTQANDVEVMNDALNFRREGIPCDVIGLEPGWMETFYDASVDKKWSSERFPIQRYAWTGQHSFLKAISRMGFHTELWLCCDYDLSWHEERRRGGAVDPSEHGKSGGFFRSDPELDAGFSEPRNLDAATRPEESWFRHLAPFVDQGIDFFKQDGSFQIFDHPDRRWGNRMDDAEMHNLYPLLYARQMHEGFEAHTARRALTFTPCGWAGFQAWAGTWTGDTGGRRPTLGALLNTAAVGHSWATNDMEVAEKEGIHLGYLLPWSQINSWNYFRMPWIQGKAFAAMHRSYARLRSRLIPYLYSWAYEATRSGRPLMLPLAIEFPDEAETRAILTQYLLGRDLMVTAYAADAYFPRGRWKDFWTGELVDGGARRPIAWPDDRGGGLYVREGGIVSLGPIMQYRGELPLDEIELYAFPGATETSFTLYRDDGVSLGHRAGRFATTTITARWNDGRAVVTVGPTEGSYDGQPQQVRWTFTIALDRRPAAVTADGIALADGAWDFDEARRELVVRRPLEAPLTLEALVP